MVDRTSIKRLAALFLSLLAMVSPLGCATHGREIAPLDAATRAQISQFRITMGPSEPARAFGPLPKSGSKGGSAAAAAGSTFVGMTLEGAKDGPVGLIVGGALGIIMAPFAAIIGAATTDVSVQPETIAANQRLMEAVAQGDWAEQLQAAMSARLDSLGASAKTGIDAGEASALGLWLEGPWLVLDGSDGIPALTVHGELIVEDSCVLDRRWRWNGAGEDFVNLSEQGSKAFKKQLSAGISQLGNAIVADLLVEQAPRKVEYKDEKSAAGGALPLIATNPEDHQKQIGSWDKTPTELALEPRCGRLAALRETTPDNPQPDAPSHEQPREHNL